MSACGRNIRGPRTRPTPSAASTGYAPAGRGMDTAAALALPRARLDHGYGLLYGDVARAGLKTSGGDCAARKGQTAPDPARATQRRGRPKRSSRADRRSSASRGTKHKRKSNNDVDYRAAQPHPRADSHPRDCARDRAFGGQCGTAARARRGKGGRPGRPSTPCGANSTICRSMARS